MAPRKTKPFWHRRLTAAATLAKPLHLCLIAAIALIDLMNRVAEYIG